jgi:hypothetical protein
MVKHCALTNVSSDRGFESWPGYEVKPPDCHISLEGHRIDICESAVLDHFAI